MSWATIRPSLRQPGPVVDHRRVPLGRRRQVLVAVVDHPHRLARPPRQERRVEGDHRRVLLLAAEPAAGLRLDDLDERRVEAHARDQRLVDVVRALEAAVDGDPAVLAWQRDHRVVLDVQLLLVADAVGALDHDVGGGERRVHVAAPELVVGEHDVRLERVEDGRERLGAERHPALRLAERLAVRARRSARRARPGAGSRRRPGRGSAGPTRGSRRSSCPGCRPRSRRRRGPRGTPGRARSRAAVAWASVERIVAPYQAPGNTRSSV